MPRKSSGLGARVCAQSPAPSVRRETEEQEWEVGIWGFPTPYFLLPTSVLLARRGHHCDVPDAEGPLIIWSTNCTGAEPVNSTREPLACTCNP